MAQTQNEIAVLQSSINPNSLTLGDWLKIADAIDKPEQWAYRYWNENTSSDLSTLSLEDWEAIGEMLGYEDGWAYWRYKENR